MDKLQEIREAKRRADKISDYITRDIDQADDWLEVLLETVEQLTAQNTAMKEALEWYASESTYDIEHLNMYGYIRIDKDVGYRARTALSTIEGGKATLDPRGGDAE